jgi:hypothetical protein
MGKQRCQALDYQRVNNVQYGEGSSSESDENGDPAAGTDEQQGRGLPPELSPATHEVEHANSGRGQRQEPQYVENFQESPREVETDQYGVSDEEDSHSKQPRPLRPRDAPARMCHDITAAGEVIFLPTHHGREQQFWINDGDSCPIHCTPNEFGTQGGEHKGMAPTVFRVLDQGYDIDKSERAYNEEVEEAER